MKRTQMGFVGLFLLVVWLTLVPVTSVGAQTPPQTPDAGLAVLGALAEYTVTPGQVLTHKMTVSLGAQATPLDIQVDARGLGQGPDGAVVPLTDKEDSSRFSARPFIQKIDVTTFHLNPGTSQTVTATIALPKDLTAGWRYADIYIHSLPAGSGRIGVISAASVPVILQVSGSTPVETGKITGLAVDRVVPGRPIDVTTTFHNTGDHHYKVQNAVQIFDASGQVVASQSAPVTGFSIVPTYSRDIKVSFTLLDKLQGLATGKYTAESKIMTPDGKVIDTQKTIFDIAEPYHPFLCLDPANVLVTTFNNEVPGTIDARRQADAVLAFRDTGKVTGTVVICKFKDEPPGDPRFSATSDKGGMGQSPVKFVGIGVAGFSQGTAQVQLYFTDTETRGFSLNSLFLAARANTSWAKLDKLGVFTGAQNAQGDTPVAALNLNPIIALGGESTTSAKAAAPPSNFPTLEVAAGGVGVAIILAAALRTTRNRRPKSRPLVRNRLADREL